jgi:hypothetical protein
VEDVLLPVFKRCGIEQADESAAHFSICIQSLAVFLPNMISGQKVLAVLTALDLWRGGLLLVVSILRSFQTR